MTDESKIALINSEVNQYYGMMQEPHTRPNVINRLSAKMEELKFRGVIRDFRVLYEKNQEFPLVEYYISKFGIDDIHTVNFKAEERDRRLKDILDNKE